MTVQVAKRGPEAARIDTRPDTAKIGSDGRVEVQRAWLCADFGGRKTFPLGLDPLRTSLALQTFAPALGSGILARGTTNGLDQEKAGKRATAAGRDGPRLRKSGVLKTCKPGARKPKPTKPHSLTGIPELTKPAAWRSQPLWNPGRGSAIGSEALPAQVNRHCASRREDVHYGNDTR